MLSGAFCKLMGSPSEPGYARHSSPPHRQKKQGRLLHTQKPPLFTLSPLAIFTHASHAAHFIFTQISTKINIQLAKVLRRFGHMFHRNLG
jgi:hypothetical protein